MRLPRVCRFFLFALLVGAASYGCASTSGSPALASEPRADRDAQVGYASYYARRFHGRPTASGELYDERALTAAHRSLPHGTKVRVTNLANGASVVLRVNDRGPWGRKRIVDVSYAAARRLGFVRDGIARVRLDVVAMGEPDE